jgi:hypothetical protein
MLGAKKRRTVTRITARLVNYEENLKWQSVFHPIRPISQWLVSACLLIATSGRTILFQP